LPVQGPRPHSTRFGAGSSSAGEGCSDGQGAVASCQSPSLHKMICCTQTVPDDHSSRLPVATLLTAGFLLPAGLRQLPVVSRSPMLGGEMAVTDIYLLSQQKNVLSVFTFSFPEIHFYMFPL